MKRRTVDRVDRGNAQSGRGRSAQDAGLGTVRVDDLRLDFAEQLQQAAIARPIAGRMDAALHLGDDPQVESAGPGPLFEASFRAESRPRDEDYLVSEPMLVLDVEQRVFLGSADDQAGDDVGDAEFHERASSRAAAGNSAPASCGASS